MDIKTLLPTAQKNVLLSQYSTFRIGGPAKYFFEAKTEEDILKAIEATQKIGLPFFILAGGSNVLFSDNGFDGLIIKIQLNKEEIKVQGLKIIIQAGKNLSEIVSLSSKLGLSGIEWGAGIFGTIGGAIRGNAGAFGHSMAEIVKQVRVLVLPQLEIKNFSTDDCQFSYRDSIFKHNKNLIILSAEIHLKNGNLVEVKKKMDQYIQYRKERQPLEFASAGSIFKNVALAKIKKETLKAYPELEKFSEIGIIPSAFLIEKCGLKGKQIGQAQISEKHSNFIINLGKANAQNVKDLISLAKEKVFDKFGIQLEEEIIVL